MRSSRLSTRRNQHPDPGRTAAVVRSELRRRRVDCAPLEELRRVLGVGEATLRTAVAHSRDLGTCGPAERPLVWSLPSAALVGGFAPRLIQGRLVLHLLSPDRRTLIISGRRVGPAQHDWAGTAGHGPGELGYAITRLSALARRWLVPRQPGSTHWLTGRLVELIGRTWQTSPQPTWSCGLLHVHQADLGEPVGVRFWADGARTSWLELAVETDRAGVAELVNVYPAGQHSAIFAGRGVSEP